MRSVGSRLGWLAVACGAVTGLAGAFPRPVVVRWSVPLFEDNQYVPAARQDSGDELVFILIGASGCRWSNHSGLPALISEARTAVRDQSRIASTGFASIGLASDIVAEKGIEYLQRFGRFDQIVTGMGWRNMGMMKYIYGDLSGPALTPQVLVVARSIVVDAGDRTIRNERVLVRRLGLSRIRQWVEGGSRVPEFGAAGP